MAAIREKRKWREGQSSPYTGKLSARPAGKPGYLIAKESLRRSLRRHCLSLNFQRTILGAQYAFLKAWRNLSVRCGQDFNQIPGREPSLLPSVGPEPRQKNVSGGSRPHSSSAMSSGRLFLDRVARQHCPSPLHRHTQINMHSAQAQGKGDISILPGKGHFYFALTLSIFPLDISLV
jgi:hypothetical protein